MRSRRACLSVPGSSAKMVGKARGIVVDEIVLDLEDAVVPDDKDDARAQVAAAVAEPGWACGQVAVRVNAVGTPWCHEDLIALAGGPASVVLPKVEHPDDLAFADRLLAGVEARRGLDRPLGIQALIESPAGLVHAGAIAAHPRVEALILGYADLAASLGRAGSMARDPRAWAPAQHDVLRAARAHGVRAIDGPWLGTAVDDAFLDAAAHAADLGFDGKWAIHPQQVAALHARFTPDEAQVTWAQRVLDALAAADGGAVALDGQMLDEAVAVAARRVLERARVGA